MSRHNVEEQIGGAHHFGAITQMVECADCITMAKCCGEFFADGQCCGGGEMITVQCPEHAVADALTKINTALGEK